MIHSPHMSRHGNSQSLWLRNRPFSTVLFQWIPITDRYNVSPPPQHAGARAMASKFPRLPVSSTPKPRALPIYVALLFGLRAACTCFALPCIIGFLMQPRCQVPAPSAIVTTCRARASARRNSKLFTCGAVRHASASSPEGLGRFGIDYVTPVGCAALQRSCRPAVLGPSANRKLVPDQRGSRLFTSLLAACRVNPFAPLRIQPLAAPRCLGLGTQKPREAGVL